MTSVLLFLDYLKSEKRYSPLTIEAYHSDLSQFSDFISLKYDLSDLIAANHLIIRSWLADLAKNQIGAKSINRKISALKSFFKWARKRKGLVANPMRKIISPKTGKRLPMVAEQTDLTTLLDCSKTDSIAIDNFKAYRDHLMLKCLYELGLRRAELIDLQMKNLNLKQGQLKVTGKGGKERIIPMGNELISEFSRYILLSTEMGLDKGGYVFTNEDGKSLYPKLVYRIVNQYLKSIPALSKKSPHILRHSFATHLAANGADIHAIKNLLGHSSLAATQVYMHNSIEQLKAVYNRAHPRAETIDSQNSITNKIVNV